MYIIYCIYTSYTAVLHFGTTRRYLTPYTLDNSTYKREVLFVARGFFYQSGKTACHKNLFCFDLSATIVNTIPNSSVAHQHKLSKQ